MAKLRKILIALLLLCSSIFSARVAFADTVDITVSNTSLSTNAINGGTSTEFSFDFAVPNSAKSGDTTVISLPDELNFQRNQTFNVYASDGTTVVATAVIDTTTKTLTLTYTDYVDTHDDVTGHLSMNVVVDRTVVTEATTVPATVTINGTTTITISSGGINYTVSTGDSDDIDFWKYGVSYSDDEVMYLINVNTSAATVSNVVISDTINSAGLEYVDGSFEIFEGTWYKNAQNYWALGGSTNVTSNYNIELSADNTSFSINLGTISKGYMIRYRVKANYTLINGEQLSNSATYYSENTALNNADNTFTYQGASGTASGYNYSLTVQKVNEAGEALAGAEFTVTRESTGQVVGTITTGSDGTATISGLLKDNYIITETKAPTGYAIADPVTAEADNSTVTVTDKKATVEVTGTKTWDDNNDQDGKRPDSITVNLLANGTVVDTKTVTADSNWSYVFTDLPKYANGNEITYTVTEDAVADYTTTYDGYNITNSYTPGETSITVTKAWDDNNDQDGIRPDAIQVQLYADGEKSGDAITLTAADNWTYTWTGLAEKANKQDITYTVEEVSAVDGYATTTGVVENGNVTITNVHNPSTTSLKVDKVWNDNDDQDGLRPTSVTINLLANGEVVDTVDVTPNADGDWTYTFTDLAEYSNGEKVTYTVEEVNTPEGYTSSVDGTTITNTHTPETTEVSGTKVWDDNNDQDGLRPDSIIVNLLANGEVVASQTVTADNDWNYAFTDLPKYDNGNEIVYTVDEATTPDGYTSSVDGTTITNTHTPETTEVSGTKTWADNDDQDGKRPASITVNLLANGTVVDTKTVTADDNWSYSFTDLPKYDNGNEITYTVTEDTVADYTTTYDGYNITNSYTPGETSITVTKVWDDNNDQDGIRPDAIQVQLYANGEKSGDVITLTVADNWTYTWTGLAEKANKKTITYTVEEVSAVDGYTATVGEVDNGNVTITNTHTPTTPETPSSDEPTTPSQSNKKSDKEQDKNIIAALLPSTGSRSGLGLTILGLVLVIALLAGLVYHKVKKA
ncbi:Cna B-type domain-containing protein [Streptococcus gallolyticus subsp. gallolyticus]|uniref:Cna B-type domain-containing protein n=2 Tax=Streptococcus gallolyticus TaxID=315405 RepID=UPI000201B815|nr:Cna B-type domain-containing protein [Streptococcus gallolyticus]MCY7158648.1 Cna B-type domain-containing protein [Streptococcus gallolyticus subsp. gallolyticus]BAK27437.1 Cna protein B-type domain-containing protein [Streptococcus gallolyticus subsp. gallolyticus ATCC 43143]CBZ47683.1 Collagen adhesin [Streptococcus gallolyticus subsp. gallolyticus ATCC BAA-2069]